jgi:hypothetical protein
MSPEKIEMETDVSYQYSGEVWNLGAILYTIHEG